MPIVFTKMPECIPQGYRIAKVGDMIDRHALYNSMGAGEWVPVTDGATHRIGKRLVGGLVAFCVATIDLTL